MNFDKEEYEFGKQSELDNLTNLRKLNPNLKEIKNKFAPFDFVDDTNTVYVELKTRRNKRNQYPTTMVPESKIKKIVVGNTYYFAFKFTDGLYYIKYDKEIFDSFEIKQGGRYDRGRPEVENYCYIPVELLQPLQV